MSSFRVWMKLVYNNPEAEAQRSLAQSAKNRLSLSCNYTADCLRVIVNDFHPNLEQMTSSVLSVILINLCLSKSFVI